MTARRFKKVKKYRGSKTHGCGSMKKRRGAGNRGGRGNAGSGKRGDANKQTFLKKKYFGKRGFKKKGIKMQEKVIKLSEVEIMATEAKNGTLDLAGKGFTKLLGNGSITKKLKIKIPAASKSAIEKVKAAGGSVETSEPGVASSKEE